MTDGTGALHQTLDRVAELGQGIDEPWWVFGGAAMALYRLADEPVPDVDLLTTRQGCLAWADALSAERVVPADQTRFRSWRLHRSSSSPLPVEVMADLEVNTPTGWVPIAFQTRVEHPWAGRRLFAPAAREHARVSRRIGRPKDLRRAADLEALKDPA